MGRRVKKTVYVYASAAWQLEKEILFVYDGWNLIEEQESSGQNPGSRFYVWGLDLSQSLQGAGGVGGLIASIDTSLSKMYNYFYDSNGNVGQLVDTSDGSIAAGHQYDPFGKLLYSSGPIADENPFRFSTKYQDDETGLLWYGYRFYAPSLGRWINRDPIGEIGGFNLYSFTYNDPIGKYDTLGLIGPWVKIVHDCTLSALKKLALDYAGRALRRQRICIQVADKLCTDTSCFSNPCGNHPIKLDKDPFNVDTDNWAQLTLSCLLNVVKEKGGINRILDSIDDESQKKLIEKLISEGEGSLVDMLADAKARNKYTINFSCDTQTTVIYMLQISTVIQFEGEEHPIEVPLNLEPEQARCHKAPGISCSAFIEDLCCSCKNLPRKP